MANTLTPPSARLKASASQKFSVSLLWSIDPAGMGDIDANGSYTAPALIEAKREVQAVAKDA
jgi:hypothetical protein